MISRGGAITGNSRRDFSSATTLLTNGQPCRRQVVKIDDTARPTKNSPICQLNDIGVRFAANSFHGIWKPRVRDEGAVVRHYYFWNAEVTKIFNISAMTDEDDKVQN
jgi:hypothetical protein